MKLLRPFIFTIFLLLLAACGKATPAPTATPLPPTAAPSAPTSTPLPPEMQALVDEYLLQIQEINSVLSLYERENTNREDLDRSMRILVPTAEALTEKLQATGIDVPPIPLPPTPAFEPQVERFDIGMVTEDGVKLRGTYYNPGVANAPGVVLLHMLGRQRSDWEAFAGQLQEAGYGVIAIDLRGHGESEGERDFSAMTKDAAIAAKFLRAREEIDPGRLAIIGASVGANIALNYAAEDPGILGAVLLSPGLDYRGVTTEDALKRYGDRLLLIVASEEDSYAASSSETLAAEAANAELVMLSDQGHGTRMLNEESGLEQTILDWLAVLFEK